MATKIQNELRNTFGICTRKTISIILADYKSVMKYKSIKNNKKTIDTHNII